MDGGRVLQQGTPAHIHSAPRNARVADLVGIQNRFQGEWLGPAAAPGRGRLRWTDGGNADAARPVLTVPDKGKRPLGHAVYCAIPNDGIVLIDPGARGAGDFDAEVVEARQLGEITLATLSVSAVPGARLVLTLAGAQRQSLRPGARLCARLDPGRVHLMPWRTPPGATQCDG